MARERRCTGDVFFLRRNGLRTGCPFECEARSNNMSFNTQPDPQHGVARTIAHALVFVVVFVVVVDCVY